MFSKSGELILLPGVAYTVYDSVLKISCKQVKCLDVSITFAVNKDGYLELFFFRSHTF